MANINSNLKPTAERGRNVFPLDNVQTYSQKIGELTPVKAIHVIPNDYMEIEVTDFSLSLPMNTAAFLRGRKEFNAYFVPYNDIWTQFNQYMAQRDDVKSSAFAETGLFEPKLNLFSVYYFVFELYVSYVVIHFFGENHANYTWLPQLDGRVTTDLGTTFDLDAYLQLVDSTHTAPIGNLNFQTLLDDLFSQYQDSWPEFDFLTSGSSDWNTRYLPVLQNLDWDGVDFRVLNGDEYLDFSTLYFDILNRPRWTTILKKLDMLGYGNLLPLFEECSQIIQVGFDHFDTSTGETDKVYGVLSHVFVTLRLLLQRLIEMGYGVDTDGNIYEKAYQVSPFAICAYNSVFYHYFRNSFYDTNYSSYNYSLDFVANLIYKTPSDRDKAEYLDVFDFSPRFLDLEYHQWKKDLFTGVMPSTQFGAVSSINLTGSLSLVGETNYNSAYVGSFTQSSMPSNAQFQALPPTYTSSDLLASNGNPVLHKHSFNLDYDTSSAFDVIALKRAQMLQEYRQTLMRAGNKTSDVFRALYGKEPHSEITRCPRFLESFGNNLFVDKVVATADTGTGNNGNLGDLSGRSQIQVNSPKIRFRSDGDFGVILVLSSIIPEAEYNSYMIDKHNINLTPEDHFISTFENKGYSPVQRELLNQYELQDAVGLRGYQVPYFEFKTDVDQVHGIFCSISAEHLIQSDQTYMNLFLDKYIGKNYYGQLSHWVAPRTDMQNSKALTLANFYINPSVFDNVFIAEARNEIGDDHFMCRTALSVKATREISVLGLMDFV